MPDIILLEIVFIDLKWKIVHEIKLFSFVDVNLSNISAS